MNLIYLLIHLSKERLQQGLYLFVLKLSAAPGSYTKGVIRIDSDPNLIYLTVFLTASSLPVSSSLSSAVGPSKKSPNVPVSSVSASVSPAAPPATPAANLVLQLFCLIYQLPSHLSLHLVI